MKVKRYWFNHTITLRLPRLAVAFGPSYWKTSWSTRRLLGHGVWKARVFYVGRYHFVAYVGKER